MKTCQMYMAALAMLAGAISAQAHQYDPSAKVVISCKQGWTPHMYDVSRAVERNHFSATPSARTEMLALSRQACASGAKGLAFVPPSNQR